MCINFSNDAYLRAIHCCTILNSKDPGFIRKEQLLEPLYRGLLFLGYHLNRAFVHNGPACEMIKCTHIHQHFY